MRIEAGVELLDLLQAAHKQSRAHEKTHGDGDFCDHEPGAQALPSAARGFRAATFLQCLEPAGVRHLPGWGDTAEENTGHCRPRPGKEGSASRDGS